MLEFGARLSLKDNMYATLQKNLRLQRDFSEQVQQTSTRVRGLGNMTASPTITARDNATDIVDGIRSTVENVGSMVATPEMGIEDNATDAIREMVRELNALNSQSANPAVNLEDEASKKADEIIEKIRNIGRMAVAPVIRMRDQISTQAGKIKQKLNDIATTYTPIARLRDLATQGVSKLKNTLGGLSQKWTAVIFAKDVASKVISKIRSNLKIMGKSTTKPKVDIHDMATKTLNAIKEGLKVVGDMAVKPLVAIKDGATAGLSKIKDILGTLAKGVTIAVGLAGAGATALLAGSIHEGANLEQSIGGVETLYGVDAGKVIQNADLAFQTAGLSANEYMETVTSFSASLLQSLNGDTTRSADLANQAIKDMADNANKFGSDIGSIQNAYQGFAKQNYTMLDNLKLGYGGTQEEMQRLLKDAEALSGVKYDMSNLSDVYNAIHAIQDNLGIAGATAEEASTTFSGSFASMKASFQNFMGNLALGGDITGSLEALVGSAETFLDNAVPMIGRIFDSLPDVIGYAIEKGIPKIKELGGKIVIALKDTLKNILPTELGSLVDPAFDGVGTALRGAVGLAKNIASGIVPVITAIVPIVEKLGSAFSEVAPVIKDALGSAFGDSGGIINTLLNVVDSAIPVITGIITEMAKTIGAVLPSVFALIETLGSVFVSVMPIISSLTSIFGQIIQTVYPIIYNAISMALNAVIPIVQAFSGLIQSALPIIQGIIQTFSNVVATIFPVVQKIFQGLGEKIAQVVGVVTEHMGLIQGIFETVSPIIQGAIEIVASVLSTAWDIISPIIDLALTIFDALLTCVEAVFPTVQSVIETVWSYLEPVFKAIADGLSIVGDAIGGVADFIGGGIDTIKGWFGFAYGKDRVPYDGYPAVLHEGEKVLTRNQADQYERAMSTRGVQLNNALAVTGGESSGDNAGGNSGEAVGGTQKPQTVEPKIEVTVSFDGANINNLGDMEEVADKVTEAMVRKMRKIIPNMA